jgi:hypothetical protein
MTNILQTISALELAAAAAPIQAALTTVANGDGTTQSLAGQGLILEAQLIALLPTLQKVGITNLATYLNTQLTAFVAKQVNAQTAASVTSTATASAIATGPGKTPGESGAL